MRPGELNRRPLSAPLVGGSAVVVLLAAACMTVLGGWSWEPLVTGDTVTVVSAALAGACGIYAARRNRGPLRRAWVLLATMALLLSSGGVLWLLDGGTSATPRTVDASDAFYLVSLAPAVAGLLVYPMTQGLRQTWRPLLVDGLVLGSSTLLLMSLFGLSEVSGALEGGEAFVYLVYPVTDALLFSLVVVLLLRSTGRLRLDVVLVALMFAAYALADLGYSLSSVRGVALSSAYQMGYVAAALLLASGAIAAATLPTKPRVLHTDFAGPVAPVLPDLAALSALGACLVVGVSGRLEIILVVAVLTLTGLRQLTRTMHNLRMRRDLERRVVERTEEIRLITEEHRRLDAMKREFVTAVSHELRTPLTAIRGALELLETGDAGDLPEEARPVVAMASRGSERLSRLVNDIIDLERLESGTFGLRPSAHHLHPLLVDAVKSLAPLARQAGVSVHVVPTSVLVECDGDRVTQAVVNLLGNALKFTAPGGRVTIATQVLGDRLEVSIQDTGRGIPESELAAIFDRFHQVEEEGADPTSGTGLGLSITLRIVEAHGGRIRVDSELGHGSVFYFTLPLKTGAAPLDQLGHPVRETASPGTHELHYSA